MFSCFTIIPIFLHMEYGIDWLSINGSGWLHIIHKYSFLPSEYWILSHSWGGVWRQDLIEGQNLIIKICKFLLSYPSKVLHHGWVKVRILGEHHLLLSDLQSSQCPGAPQLFLSFLVTGWCSQSLRDLSWFLLMFCPLPQHTFHHYISWGIMSLSSRKIL